MKSQFYDYKYCRFIAPVVGAALVGGGAALVNSLVGSWFGNKSNHDNYANNKELMAQQNLYNVDMFNRESAFAQQEAQAQRNAQSHENQLQRNWEQKMVNQQNAWNSPEHQLAMMREAGINPLGNFGPVASASPNGVSPGGMAQASTPSQAGSSLNSVQNRNVFQPLDLSAVSGALESVARAKNLEEDARKKESERKTEDALRDLRVQEAGARVEVLAQDKQLKEQERRVLVEREKEVVQTVKNLAKTFDEIDARIEQIQASTDISRVEKKRKIRELEYFDKDKFMQYRAMDDAHNKSMKEVEVLGMSVEELAFKIVDLRTSAMSNYLDFEVKCAGHDGKVRLAYEEGELQLSILEADAEIEGNKYVRWVDKVLDFTGTMIGQVQDCVRIKNLIKGSHGSSSTVSTIYDKKGNVKGFTHTTKNSVSK